MAEPMPEGGMGGPPADKTWGILAHLSPIVGWFIPYFGNIIAPLVIWLIKKDTDPFAEACAKEALNFQISLSIYGFVVFLLCFIVIGIFLIPVLFVAAIVLMIIAAVKASNGEVYRYPLTLRLIK